MDRHARKQVLLARIAFERVELQRDVAQLREATQVTQLLRSALGGGLGNALFGARGGKASAPGSGNWFGLAMSLIRRYRLTAGLVAGVVPLLRGREGWRRVARLGALGAATAWVAWRVVKRRDD
jgi:hypothetical protein